MFMKNLSNDQVDVLISILKSRFEKNTDRHPNINWEQIFVKLSSNPEKLWSLNEMEKTGGEPDVVKYDKEKDEYVFFDCSKETPILRRSVCYDDEALNSRNSFKPSDSAVNFAKKIGIELLNEKDYIFLQTLGQFDNKSSSYIYTDEETRKLGGALFGDKRYNRTFIYHNGAESYYSSRGFRGKVNI